VLYIALEEKMDRMVLRTEQQMAGAEKSQIVNQDMSLNNKVYDAIQNHYQKNRKLLGDFYISKHMPGEVTPNQLEQIIVNTTIKKDRSEEHTSELQSRFDLVCRLLLEKKK